MRVSSLSLLGKDKNNFPFSNSKRGLRLFLLSIFSSESFRLLVSWWNLCNLWKSHTSLYYSLFVISLLTCWGIESCFDYILIFILNFFICKCFYTAVRWLKHVYIIFFLQFIYLICLKSWSVFIHKFWLLLFHFSAHLFKIILLFFWTGSYFS